MRPRLLLIGLVVLVVSAMVPLSSPHAEGPLIGVVETRVAASNDDAEELAGGWLDLASSDLEVAVEKSAQFVGIRFVALDIPQGAQITEASIRFTVDEKGGPDGTVTIRAHDTAAAEDFATTPTVSNRNITASSVTWSPLPWDTVGHSTTAQTTPDLSEIVAEVVARGDWQPGNPMVFVIEGTGTRTAESFDGSPADAPLLRVVWTTDDPVSTTTSTTVPPTTTTTTATTVPTTTTTTTTSPPPSGTVFETRVGSGGDDVEQFPSGWLYRNSSDLELVQENITQIVGIRFTRVTIPHAATIERAWIQFTVDETSVGTATLAIGAHLTGDAPAFGGSGDVGVRPLTETVTWSPPDWPVPGQSAAPQKTTDLAAQVQAIVSRPDWSSGNAMAFVIAGSGTRTAVSYDGSAAEAPMLHIEWTGGDPEPDPINQPPTVLATATSTTAGGTSTLDARITDDGLPDPPGATSVTWVQVDGPATATIDEPASPVTTATLPAPGEYRFRATVSDGEHSVSQTAVATASPAPTSSIEIAVIGDYGDGKTKEQQVAGMILDRGTDAVVTVGDNVYWHSGYDRLVGRYYHPYIGDYQGGYGPGAAENRFFPALGNHDYDDVGLDEYLEFFTLPGDGIATTGSSGNERYYDARIGDVHVFVMNSNPQEPDGLTPTTTQGDWLRNALAASDAEWKLVVLHHTPYSSIPGKAAHWMRWPFQEWGADLVLAGDAHVYERFRIGGFDYVISGLGVNHSPLDGPTAPGSVEFYSQDDAGALFITACTGTLELKYRTLNEGVIDAFQIGSGTCP